MTRKKILLIDGNNLAHRTHHAQKLSTSSGQSTGMIYGSINSILSVQRELRAEQVIVVWDVLGGSAFRKSLYPLYKGNRDEKEAVFIEEMSLLKQTLTAMGVTQVSKAGSECDDVIGYIAKCLYPEYNVYILSNDKDFLQLCDDRITVLHPDKGAYIITDGKITFKDGTKYISLRPDQIPCYKALSGDSSDNYPGMTQFGIGAAITFFSRNEHCLSIVDGTADLSGLRSVTLQGILDGRCMIKTFLTLAIINMEEGEIPQPLRPQANEALMQGLFDMLEFKQFQLLGKALLMIGGVNE